MPHLTAIVAMGPDRVIGRDGKLPWHLPEDLAFFKKTTLGHPILMGRKTFESIGKPLPKRKNFVLTRDRSWHCEGVEVIHNVDQISSLEGEIFVIGGAEIYLALRDRIDVWLVSHVHESHTGDTFLSKFEADFPRVETLEQHPDFTVKKYRRG
ncbi:MAG: dihydrofolate reductase [Armatimonadetes bacterium]|nr:dihydrofolate reductase [Akkermansiaceae bacterium]